MREATTDTDNLETERAQRDERDERDDQPGAGASGELPPSNGGWRDYYAALGVPWYATHEEIRRAYRRLAKRWHPDRYTRASKQLRLRAERQMRMLTAAYAILGDEAKRQAYDEHRRASGWADAPSPRASGIARATVSRDEPAESGNPNGAGVLAGVLALILALALLGGALGGGFGSDPLPLVIFGAIAVLLVIGAIFATSGSPLSRYANAWMEGEPRGYHVRYEPPREARREPLDEDAAEDELDDRARFERLVDEALEDVPEEFRPYLENVVVRVEEYPSAATLREANVAPGHTLLGLYHGVPLTRQGIAGAGPGVISIYRLPIERFCGGDPDATREQVRATVLHELAHHFGIDHDEMPAWVK